MMPNHDWQLQQARPFAGAGSRNWGGQLAHEVWSALVRQPLVRSNARLRDLLLEENAFELALGCANAAPFTRADRQQLE